VIVRGIGAKQAETAGNNRLANKAFHSDAVNRA
jgi:hypothetical protein